VVSHSFHQIIKHFQTTQYAQVLIHPHSERSLLQPLRSTILWSQRRRLPLAHFKHTYLNTTLAVFGNNYVCL
jgi:hypothetical protein